MQFLHYTDLNGVKVVFTLYQCLSFLLFICVIFICYRLRIMQNIAAAFIKQGQYTDAVTSLEHIMSESPSIGTGFNLVVCYYALNDKDRMKLAFQKLLTTDLKQEDEEKYLPHSVSRPIGWLSVIS